jgi:hypothetical protein
MRACFLIIYSILFCHAFILAQSPVSRFAGTLLDSLDRKPLENGEVAMVEIGKTDTVRVLTDEKGHFQINFNLKWSPGRDFILLASFIGYRTKVVHYPARQKEDLGALLLSPKIHEMQEVVVAIPPITEKEDTIEFHADAFPVRKDAVLADLLKKLPGLEVDQNGHIVAYGRPVVKIRVNGKDFFAGDPTIPTLNLPSEVIEKVQVIEDKSDQAKFSGFDDGSRTQIINVTIKKSRSDSYFGNVSAGIGTDGRYLTSVRAFRFDRNQQLALIENSNNTNGSDVTSGNTAAGPGTNNSTSLGVNYSGRLARRLSLTGSYNFMTSNQITSQYSVRSYYVDTVYSYTQNENTTSHQTSNNVQLSLGLGVGRQDTLIFTPQISYSVSRKQTYNAFSYLDASGDTTSKGGQDYASTNSSPNISGVMTWMHRFGRTGQTLSVVASAAPGPGKEADNNFSTNHIYYPASEDTIWQVSNSRTKNQRYSLNAFYTLPIDAERQVELSYSYTRNENLSIKSVYDVSKIGKIYDDSLSNSFDNSLTTNQLDLKFAEHGKKYNYQVGIGIQPTGLNSRSVLSDTLRSFDQHIWQIVPSASLFYKFSGSGQLTFSYNGFTQQPTIAELQPVPDYTNPLYIAEGNPNLKPSFSHNFRAVFTHIGKITGRVFITDALVSIKENGIVNDITFVPSGAQIIQPVNVNGNYSASTSYDYYIPLDERRYTLSFSGGINYSKNVSLYGGVTDIGRNWTGKQGLKLQYELGKWFELTTTAGYSINSTAYSRDSLRPGNLSTWTFTQEGRLNFWKDLTFRYSCNYKTDQGMSGNIGKNAWLISMIMEKRIFRDKGIFALSVNDLFNDNASYTHSAMDGYVEDDRTASINRFFLLSFTWKFLQKKGTNSAPQ